MKTRISKLDFGNGIHRYIIAHKEHWWSRWRYVMDEKYPRLFTSEEIKAMEEQTMDYNHIVHWGQIDVFPHITISLGYVDEFGNECDDAMMIYIGWLVYDFQIIIERK